MIPLISVLLIGCTNTKIVNKYIPPCRLPPTIEENAKWIDLIEKYIEVRDELILCIKKVDTHNGK